MWPAWQGGGILGAYALGCCEIESEGGIGSLGAYALKALKAAGVGRIFLIDSRGGKAWRAHSWHMHVTCSHLVEKERNHNRKAWKLIWRRVV